MKTINTPWRSAALALAATALLATGALPAFAGTVTVIDTDNDLRISQSEFAASSKPHLAVADYDHDGYLASEEMAEAAFRAWDKDGNGEIIPSEFDDGAETLAEDRAERLTFAVWDRNHDNEVHMDEFKEGIKTTGLYTSIYTTPGARIGLPQVQTSVFDYYDINNDGYLTGNEVPRGGRIYLTLD